MVFIPVVLGIFLLLLLISPIKLDTFVLFILVCIFIGIFCGLSLEKTFRAIQLGMGKTLSSLMMILGFGAMLDKLIAESGAADKITHELVTKFGLNYIQFSLILIRFIVGLTILATLKSERYRREFIVSKSN